MTSRGSGRTIPTAFAAAMLVLASAGCQSSSSEGPEAGSSSATTSTSGTAPTPTPTPTVEPADGPLIEVPGGTIRGLEGYKRDIDYGQVQGYGDEQSGVLFSPSLTNAKSLAAFARETSRDQIGKKFTEKQDDVVVGGKFTAWHLIDTSDELVQRHLFGVMYLDGAWSIDIYFYEDADPRALTEEERQAVMDSILATFAPHREN